jgi:hypothetical protein
MRAEEYLNKIDSTIKYIDEVRAALADLSPIKNDEAATRRYYDSVLVGDTGYGRDRSHHSITDYDVEGAIWREDVAAQVRYGLFKATMADKSFGHIFYLLASEQNRVNPEFAENPIDCIYVPYADNDMDFYYNTKNVPCTTLVPETVQYFEKGAGKGFFEPLDFLNLLWAQREFIHKNIDRAQTVVDYLNGLHLDERRRHILLCFIIKWAGGYPISNLNNQYRMTHSLIVKEFLKYPEDTPEKEFCRNNWHDNRAVSGDLISEDDWLRIQIEMLKKALSEKDAEITNLKNQSDMTNMDDKKGTLKVQTATLLQILKKAGVDKSNTDITKLVRLIAYLTGKNLANTYEAARIGITFAPNHHEEIDKVNEYLDDINIGISIDKNNLG